MIRTRTAEGRNRAKARGQQTHRRTFRLDRIRGLLAPALAAATVELATAKFQQAAAASAILEKMVRGRQALESVTLAGIEWAP